MNMFRMNKKGIMPMIVEIAIALIVILVSIYLISSFGKIRENKNKIEGENFLGRAIAENNIALYLKQPVKVDGKIMTMADLIVLAADNPYKYGKLFREKTEASLRNVPIGLTVSINGDKSLTVTTGVTKIEGDTSKMPGTFMEHKFEKEIVLDSTLIFPSYSGKPIEIKIQGFAYKIRQEFIGIGGKE